jgi:RecJ-like exonuclease
MRKFLFAVCLALFVLGVSPVFAEDVIPAITARELVSLYRENEIRFNKLYLDKKIQVTGEVTNVGESKGKPNLTLQDGSFMGMFAYCKTSELDAAGELDKGDTVVVIGTITVTLGKVIINDCVIKK